MRQVAHGHGVVVGQLLAGEHLGGGTLAEDGEAEDEEDVGAERLDQAGDAVVEAVDDGRDDDDGHDADDDAEDGETAAQLVGAQGVEGHLDGFFEIGDAHRARVL